MHKNNNMLEGEDELEFIAFHSNTYQLINNIWYFAGAGYNIFFLEKKY
jgi:hypothetical protein